MSGFAVVILVHGDGGCRW